MQDEELGTLWRDIQSIPDLPKRVPLTWQDFKGALAIFILVFISTFPATIPFIIMHDVPVAMRWSNGIGLILLFITGYYIGKVSGYGPLLVGVAGVRYWCTRSIVNHSFRRMKKITCYFCLLLFLPIVIFSKNRFGKTQMVC